MERTFGMMFTHAARRSSTSARAMRAAVSSSGAVISTTRTLRFDTIAASLLLEQRVELPLRLFGGRERSLGRRARRRRGGRGALAAEHRLELAPGFGGRID